MELIPLRQYLLHNPPMASPIFDLILETAEDRAIHSPGEVTQEMISESIALPTSFWKIGIATDQAYRPMVGVVGLQRFNAIDGNGELVVAVCPEQRRKGYGLKLCQGMRDWAVRMLNLRRTTNLVLADSPVVGIAKAMGDKLEGTLKEHRYKDGRYVDVLVYSWLREGA